MFLHDEHKLHHSSLQQIVLITGGLSIVGLVAFDIFQSIIVPRETSRNFRIAPFLIGRMMWPSYKALTLSLPTKFQTSLFSVFGPICFIVLLVVWMLLLILGFALIIFGIADYVRPPIINFPEALYFASTSFFTIGFGDIVAYEHAARAVVIAAAAMGLIFMALVISFLFTLQTYLQLREQTVNCLTSRAGTPASGLVLLLRYRELNIIPALGSSFIQWESWVATVLESHTAFPMLVYFRSSNQRDSWLSTLGAILDAATLMSTSIKSDTVGEAELFYWLGANTIKSICRYLGVKASDETHMSKEEFSDSLELLKSAGYDVKEMDDCFPQFILRRSGYMRYLIPLANNLALPHPVLIRRLTLDQNKKDTAKR